MRLLSVSLLALTLFIGGCGRYGPPVRAQLAEPDPVTQTDREEEPEERSTP